MMTMLKYILFCGMVLSLPVIAGQFIRPQPAKEKHISVRIVKDTVQRVITEKEYVYIKDSIQLLRLKLADEYKNAATETDKQLVLKKADLIFTKAMLNNIINAWYGTPWEFYGTTEIPNQGTIACGYFVSTALRDAGVKCDRVHLAEIASETMIRTLVDKKYITRYRNWHYLDFIKAVKNGGDGLYMIGLDYHTGFVLCEGGEVYFIHANLPGVMKEAGEKSYLLSISQYRVTGRLSANPEFIKKWLLDIDFPNLPTQN